jgi:hypothetical protein
VPAGILPDEGIGALASYILAAPIMGVLPWDFILWVNDYVPGPDTVLDDLQEASWSGYAPRQLDRSMWSVPEVEAGCATSRWGTEPQVYNPVGETEESNYGCAYVDRSNGVLRFVQRFDDADIFPVPVDGEYTVWPTFTLTTGECASLVTRMRNTRMLQKRRGHSG